MPHKRPGFTTNAPQPTNSAPTARAPEPTLANTPEPVTTPITNSPLAAASHSTPAVTTPWSFDEPNNQQMEDAHRFFEWLWNNVFPNTRGFRKLLAEDDPKSQHSKVATPTPSKGTNDDGKVDVIIIDVCSEAEQRVMTWYKQTAATMGGMSAETIADLERQSCMYYDQCLGGVTDFSDEFKTIWGIREARCKSIVDAVKCGAQPIVYTQWRENIEAHFGCANST